MTISSFLKEFSPKIGTCPQTKIGTFLQVANLAFYWIRKSKTAHASMVDQNHRFQVSEDFAAARCSKRKKRTIGDLCSMTGSLCHGLRNNPPYNWVGISTPQQIPGKQPNGAPFFSGSSGVSPVRSCGDGCFTHFLWTFFMVVVHDILYLVCIHLINTSILGIHPLFVKKTHKCKGFNKKKVKSPPFPTL